MAIDRQHYWIHGNGLSRAVLPSDVLGDDIPGHGQAPWDLTRYNLLTLIDDFSELVPHKAHLIGHGLGGHIALNIALRRPDLEVTCMGMIPANTMAQARKTRKPVEEFRQFCQSDRTYQNFVDLAKLYTRDLAHQSIFIDSMMKQDPLFPSIFLSQGFADYDWNEVDKAKSLGERFTLIVNDQDPLIDERAASDLPIRKVMQSHYGHCPWQPQTLYQYMRSNEKPATLAKPL